MIKTVIENQKRPSPPHLQCRDGSTCFSDEYTGQISIDGYDTPGLSSVRAQLSSDEWHTCRQCVFIRRQDGDASVGAQWRLVPVHDDEAVE